LLDEISDDKKGGLGGFFKAPHRVHEQKKVHARRMIGEIEDFSTLE